MNYGDDKYVDSALFSVAFGRGPRCRGRETGIGDRGAPYVRVYPLAQPTGSTMAAVSRRRALPRNDGSAASRRDGQTIHFFLQDEEAGRVMAVCHVFQVCQVCHDLYRGPGGAVR